MKKFSDLGALDDWLLKEAIKQSQHGISIEDEMIPKSIVQLGRPWINLYATNLFEGEVGNGGLRQFFDNSAGALAPIVRDALLEIGLVRYSATIRQLIAVLGAEYPLDQAVRFDMMEINPTFQKMLDQGNDQIDVWGKEFISARQKYAKINDLIVES